MKNMKPDLKFALVMLLVPGGFGLYKILNGFSSYYLLIGTGCLLFSLYFLWPALLTRLRIGWEWLGHKLGIINTTIILTVIYCFLITPVGFLLRLLNSVRGKGLGHNDTHWQLPDASLSNLKDQF